MTLAVGGDCLADVAVLPRQPRLFGAVASDPNGHAPLLAYLDYGDGGPGEPRAVMLRPGRANANNAADNIAVLRDALTQLPEAERDRVLG